MNDKTLKQAVLDELEWEPSISAEHIGVIVEDGVVTLTGHVDTYMEKVEAERVVKRVVGVRAVAQEIEVRAPSDKKTADDQIAKRALDILSWNTSVPRTGLMVSVQNGWVTLSGEVEWWYQRNEAERVVRQLTGVRGITNTITIRPRVQASDLKDRIERALKRQAEIEANAIIVQVNGGKVTLEGKVRAWFERDICEEAAWAAPGVTSVEDRIKVG